MFPFSPPPGRREIPHEGAQVPRTHFRLHHGLVPALAQRGAYRSGRPFPVQVRHPVFGGGEAPSDSKHGYLPRRRLRILPGVLPKVRLRTGFFLKAKAFFTHNEIYPDIPGQNFTNIIF